MKKNEKYVFQRKFELFSLFRTLGSLEKKENEMRMECNSKKRKEKKRNEKGVTVLRYD